MNRLLPILLVLLASLADAAEPGALEQREISHLIDHLGSSGCRFNRNGTWYESARAVSHLKRKYEYLLKKGLVGNAVEFIDRAAAQSSSSGKPYLVKCGDAAEVTSAAWFREELARFRAQSKP